MSNNEIVPGFDDERDDSLKIRLQKIEETENIRFFGDTYRNYMKQSKMFIPFLF